MARSRRIRGERPRQWFAAAVVLAGVIVDAALRGWPFQSAAKPLSDYQDPTLWQLLLSDRLTVGFVRLAFVALVLFVVASVPALVVAGRWLRTFGTSGLGADDAEAGAKTIKELEGELALTTKKLEAATAEVGRVTKQRDAARQLAGQAARSTGRRRPGRGA
jgi:hypothetical protein